MKLHYYAETDSLYIELADGAGVEPARSLTASMSIRRRWGDRRDRYRRRVGQARPRHARNRGPSARTAQGRLRGSQAWTDTRPSHLPQHGGRHRRRLAGDRPAFRAVRGRARRSRADPFETARRRLWRLPDRPPPAQLQTATRAHRGGEDEPYVVMALLHDIGDTLGSYNHPDIAAAILKPVRRRAAALDVRATTASSRAIISSITSASTATCARPARPSAFRGHRALLRALRPDGVRQGL